MAKDVKAWIGEKKIKMLINWPAQSPDLNPIVPSLESS